MRKLGVSGLTKLTHGVPTEEVVIPELTPFTGSGRRCNVDRGGWEFKRPPEPAATR